MTNFFPKLHLFDINLDDLTATSGEANAKQLALVHIKSPHKIDVGKIHLYQYLKQRDELGCLPDYIGYSENEDFLLCDKSDVQPFALTEDKVELLLINVLENILWLHSIGWSGLDLKSENLCFSEVAGRFKFLDFSQITPSNFISGAESFKNIKNDYEAVISFFEGFKNSSTSSNYKTLINLVVDLEQTNQDEFYRAVERLGLSLPLESTKFLYKQPWFSPTLTREGKDFELGKGLFTLVKGYSGVGKSSLLTRFYDLNKVNSYNTITIKSGSSKKMSVMDDFISAFNSWFEFILNSSKKEAIKTIEDQTFRNDDLLCSAFSALEKNKRSKNKGTVSLPSLRIDSKLFKYQLLNLLKKIKVKLDQDIYLIFDDFNFSGKLTVDFLEFYFKDHRNLALKCIVFYKDFRDDDYHGALKVIKKIEKEAVNVEKINVEPLGLSELKELAVMLSLGDNISSADIDNFYAITKGNPLFLKSLFVLGDEYKKVEQGSFSGVVDLFFETCPDEFASRNFCNILSVYGKAMSINFLREVSDFSEDNNAFYYSLLTLVGKGVIQIENGKVWFSHEKFGDIIRSSISSDQYNDVNLMISSFLLEQSLGDISEASVLFDIAHHSCEAFDLIKKNSEIVKLSSICFAAAVKSREISAVEIAKFYIEKALESIHKVEKEGQKIDAQFKYFVNFEYAFILKESGHSIGAIKVFNELYPNCPTERERLEVELELVKIYSLQKDKSNLVEVLDNVLDRYQYDGVANQEEFDYSLLVNSINQNLLGRSISQIKECKETVDEKEHLIQELISCGIKGFLFYDMGIVTWLGLILMERSLKKGNTRQTVIGVVGYAHYLNTYLKDFSGAIGFKDLAEEMIEKQDSDSINWGIVFGYCMLSSLNSSFEEFKMKNDNLIKTALQTEQFFFYEALTFLSLIYDISLSERPSSIKDRMYILKTIAEKHGGKLNLLNDLLLVVQAHTEKLLGQGDLSIPDLQFSPFLSGVAYTLSLKEAYLYSEEVVVAAPKIKDEKCIFGGTILEGEYLFWSFIQELSEKVGPNKKFERSSSQMARKYALLSRNSVETIHVSKKRVKLCYLLDNYVSSKHSSSGISEIETQIKNTVDLYTNLELAVAYEYIGKFFELAKFSKESEMSYYSAAYYAGETGIVGYEKRLSDGIYLSEEQTAKYKFDLKKEAQTRAQNKEILEGQRNYTNKKLESKSSTKTQETEVQSEISVDRLKEIRSELLIHLFDLDYKLSESLGYLENTCKRLLEKFSETLAKITETTGTTITWAHHEEFDFVSSDLHNNLFIILESLKQIDFTEIKSIKLDTIIDQINNTGNLILIFSFTAKDLNKDIFTNEFVAKLNSGDPRWKVKKSSSSLTAEIQIEPSKKPRSSNKAG